MLDWEEYKKTQGLKTKNSIEAVKIENPLALFKKITESKNDNVDTKLTEQESSTPFEEALKSVNENVIQEKELPIPILKESPVPTQPLDQPDPKYATQKQMNDHYNLLLSRIQTQLSSLGGGGEVNFRYLDDVNRSTLIPDNDNYVLEYDAATKKVQFTDRVGPISTLNFNLDYVPSDEPVGTLSWNKNDETLNLFHPNGVVQQVGQELYAYVRNETGSLITNGTTVRFAGGVGNNGEARLLVTPFTANGEYPSLYTLGIATSDIDDNSNGRVTVWGKIRDINASGSGTVPTETWLAGDILYAHPTYAGGLTKFKPTSPNNVIPIAAVLSNNAIAGELFVRPTIEQRYDYATVSSTLTQSITLGINTPHKMALNTIIDDRGITIDSVDSSKVVFSQSGLYAIGLNAQILSSNAAKKEVFFWIRKNDIDVPYSTRTISVVGNLVYTNFGVSYNVSAQAGDYVQFMWASNDATVALESGPTTSFYPTSPSVYIHIDQAAL